MISLRSSLGAAFVALAVQPVWAQPAVPPVQFSIDGAIQATTENHAFWGLAQKFSPTAGYADSVNWLEGFVRPAVQVRHTLDGGLQLRSGASLLASATAGKDVFQQGDTGRVLVEDLYFGLAGATAGGLRYDVSIGAQPYRLGSGFLLSAGGGNGFERGGAILSPRKAWEMTGIARASTGPWTFEGFYLDANELKSSDTGTRLAGVRSEWSPDPQTALGVAWFRVTDSSAPWPKAPVQVIEGGRDGLQTLAIHWRHEPSAGAFHGFSVQGEAAWQRNSRVNMRASAVGAEVAYRWGTVAMAPRLSYSVRRFGGDDPSTDRLERFDSLFYDGGPATWSSGGNGSFAFYNSNLVVHRVRLDLVLSQRDFVNLSYWNVRAAEANSPVQYGQAARLSVTGGAPTLVSGFPARALSQELYLEHTRVINRNLFATWGLALAFPQSGVKALVADAPLWWGGLANLTFKY